MEAPYIIVELSPDPDSAYHYAIIHRESGRVVGHYGPLEYALESLKFYNEYGE